MMMKKKLVRCYSICAERIHFARKCGSLFVGAPEEEEEKVRMDRWMDE